MAFGGGEDHLHLGGAGSDLQTLARTEFELATRCATSRRCQHHRSEQRKKTRCGSDPTRLDGEGQCWRGRMGKGGVGVAGELGGGMGGEATGEVSGLAMAEQGRKEE